MVFLHPNAAPAGDCSTVTPSDDPLAKPAKSIRCGTAGDLVVTTASGNVRTIPSVQAGETVPIACTHVMAATTAGNIVAYHEF